MHGDTKHDAEDGSPATQEAAPGEASAAQPGGDAGAPPVEASPDAAGDAADVQAVAQTTADEADRAGIFPDETPRGEDWEPVVGSATPVQVDVVAVGPDADIEETLGDTPAEAMAGAAPEESEGFLEESAAVRVPSRVSLPAVEARRRGNVAPAAISIEHVDEDATFRLRPEGDLSGLATDIARLGQLFPVDVRQVGENHYQLICGFRRVAALRFLQRDVVLARLHTELSDEDALLMALAAAVHAAPVSPEELTELRDRLDGEGRLSAAARDMFEKALATESSLAPEGVEEEIDADELASDVAQRLGALNQDLSLLADVFAALDESRRAELLMQLRYSSDLVTYLENL
jgi:ParB family transcriptional regulator, chromosome partitioning protein